MIQDTVLIRWSHFTIWNAGKQGRRFYRSLCPHNQAKVPPTPQAYSVRLLFTRNSHKVTAFCDVDDKKIAQGVYIYEESKVSRHPWYCTAHNPPHCSLSPSPVFPLCISPKAKPPFILCVKWVSMCCLHVLPCILNVCVCVCVCVCAGPNWRRI